MSDTDYINAITKRFFGLPNLDKALDFFSRTTNKQLSNPGGDYPHEELMIMNSISAFLEFNPEGEWVEFIARFSVALAEFREREGLNKASFDNANVSEFEVTLPVELMNKFDSMPALSRNRVMDFSFRFWDSQKVGYLPNRPKSKLQSVIFEMALSFVSEHPDETDFEVLLEWSDGWFTREMEKLIGPMAHKLSLVKINSVMAGGPTSSLVQSEPITVSGTCPVTHKEADSK